MQRTASTSSTPRSTRTLRPLAEQLAALTTAERELVISVARHHEQNLRSIVSWEDLWKAKGTIHLGGDAVADCQALYDNC